MNTLILFLILFLFQINFAQQDLVSDKITAIAILNTQENPIYIQGDNKQIEFDINLSNLESIIFYDFYIYNRNNNTSILLMSAVSTRRGTLTIHDTNSNFALYGSNSILGWELLIRDNNFNLIERAIISKTEPSSSLSSLNQPNYNNILMANIKQINTNDTTPIYFKYNSSFNNVVIFSTLDNYPIQYDKLKVEIHKFGDQSMDDGSKFGESINSLGYIYSDHDNIFYLYRNITINQLQNFTNLIGVGISISNEYDQIIALGTIGLADNVVDIYPPYQKLYTGIYTEQSSWQITDNFYLCIEQNNKVYGSYSNVGIIRGELDIKTGIIQGYWLESITYDDYLGNKGLFSLYINANTTDSYIYGNFTYDMNSYIAYDIIETKKTYKATPTLNQCAYSDQDYIHGTYKNNITTLYTCFNNETLTYNGTYNDNTANITGECLDEICFGIYSETEGDNVTITTGYDLYVVNNNTLINFYVSDDLLYSGYEYLDLIDNTTCKDFTSNNLDNNNGIELSCENNVFQNDGTCIDIGNNNYTCLCLDGYEGYNCETDTSIYILSLNDSYIIKIYIYIYIVLAVVLIFFHHFHHILIF